MKFLMDFLNSGTEDQQAKKRVGALLLAITAALLAVAVIVLTVSSIVTAVKNKDQADPEETFDPTVPPAYYVAGELGEELASAGTLLLIDEMHPYVGNEPFITMNQADRPKTEGGSWVYSVVWGQCDGKISQTTVNAFNRMMKAFYAATKDDCLYLWKAANGTFLTLNYVDMDGELGSDGKPMKVSIYDTQTQSVVEPYTWIYEHAHEYGFVQASSAAGEENIFRYVGEAHATFMRNNDKTMTLAEYLETLKDRSAHKPLVVKALNAKGEQVEYNVYYVASDAEHVFLPKNSEAYVVSGDNLGGYVVTVDTTKLQAVSDEESTESDSDSDSESDSDSDASVG